MKSNEIAVLRSPLKLTIEIDGVNDQCDRLLNTHWFALISKIEIIDEWFNRSQETLSYDQMKSEDPNQFHHMKFIIQVLHTVNQLKTDHPPTIQPHDHDPRSTQLMTIQPHDNQTNTHPTKPRIANNNSTQSTITHSPEITNHNQSPDSHYLPNSK